MRIVLDTNVLLSGIFFGGVPGRILDAWRYGEITLLISPQILEEYRRVVNTLTERYGELEVLPILSLLAVEADVIDAPELSEPVSRDPADDKFLACASAGGAAVVVSGDDDLLSLREWHGIEILSPRSFVERYLSTHDE